MRRLRYVLLLPFVLFACQDSSINYSGTPLPEEIDFNFHIRPILSNNCYLCHGPDISTREADLRLDTKEGATRKGENGKAIVPGNPGRSLLIQRLVSEDPEYRMPPKDQKRTLSNREFALLEKWIDQGAKYKDPWWLLEPKMPDIPMALEAWNPSNNIDRFIYQKLDSQGLSAPKSVNKNQELRRLSFALTGLPPSPEDLADYLNDSSDAAYEREVDRLLDSPHYGEKWARHWLDLARYAETKGHEFDYPVFGAWMYRDYLIKAFNDDISYKRFVVEQLAGDLIEGRIDPETGDNQSLIATMFSLLNEETHSPVNVRKHQIDRIDNQIDVTSKTFMALTVACAKCHDHKFDPIPTTDYHAMLGMFESSRQVKHPRVNESDMRAMKEGTQLRKAMRQQLKSYLLLLGNNGANPNPSALGETISPIDGESFKMIEDFRDGSWEDWKQAGYAFGDAPSTGEPQYDMDSGNLLGFLPHAASGRIVKPGLSGILLSPNFVIDSDSIAFSASGINGTVRVIVENFHMIQNPIYGQLSTKVDSNGFQTYRIDVSKWKGMNAYIEISNTGYQGQYLDWKEDSYVEVEWLASYSDSFEKLEKAVSVVSSGNALTNWLAERSNNADIELLNRDVKSGNLSYDFRLPQSGLYNLIAETKEPELFYGLFPGDKNIESPVFTRGNYKTPEDSTVPHRFLSAFSSSEEVFTRSPSGRLEFAEAIATEDNPMSARVYVNRIWHHLFGKGIVASTDNFGAQGKLPTHPKLLDFLALKFMENGWSSKSIIKEMVMSSTFRQSSRASEEATRIDPDNLLLHSYPSRRLEAETIRDAILAASNELDRQLYGPSSKVYLTDFMNGRGRPSESGPIDGDGRRSIYQEIRRNFLSPFMLAFDMPIPFSSTGTRTTSNVPAQSLTFMNDPFVHEMSRRWGSELLKDAASQEERIDSIYLSALSREASPEEIQNGLDFLTENGGLDSMDSWSALVHVVFNLKEFIYLF